MNFTELFGIYYGKYRGEATPPASTDDEWKIAIRNYNSAVLRMQHYDDTRWNFLYDTLQNASTGTKVLTTGDTTYAAPTNMSEPGGFITYIDTDGNRSNRPLMQPFETQIMSSTASYGYFTGNENSGFVLNVNPAPSTQENGYGIDYVYYRKPTLLDPDTETGTSIIEGGDPNFYVYSMLAARFQNSRNWSAYQTSLRDAEDALKNMRLKNNSGAHYNSWVLMDTSGDGFGV